MSWTEKLNLRENEQMLNVQKIVDFLTQINTHYAYDMFMQYVHPDKEVREQSKKLGDALEQLENTLSTNKNIFSMIDGLNVDPLSNDMNMVYCQMVRDMRRSGCALSDEDNARVKAISDEMTELSSAFNKNIVDTKVSIELDGDEVVALQGFCKKYDVRIPETNCLELKGYGLYFKILEYCDVESVRRKAYIAFNTGAKDNLRILSRLQELRAENAKLMGYNSHADFKLEINAIESADKALSFLEKFRTEMTPVLAVEQKDVSRALNISINDLMMAYNNSFYLENYRIQEHDVDATFYRDYFEINNVMKQMLSIYEKFFGVTFERDSDVSGNIRSDLQLLQPEVATTVETLTGHNSLGVNNTWHDDVDLLQVKTTDGRVLGKVFLDLYARDGKWSHPTHFGLIRKHLYLDGTTHNCTSALLMSITKGTEGKPTLLTHDEVVTMFHEFGHAMHQLMNESTIATLGGTAVTRDLVEVPSMFLEYLCWDRDNLRQIGQHWQTGEPIPWDKLNNLIASKYVCASFHYLRQLSYGLFDLGFHTGKFGVDDFNNQITEICKIIRPPGTFGVTKFNHLVGYDARYYTYMFSESYAAQIYHMIFGKEGRNNQMHAKYLDFLRHSTKEQLVRDFGPNSPVDLIRDIQG